MREIGSADPTPASMISIIVPTYKEAANIRHLVERISEVMTPTGRNYEIVIVDDNSRDGTDSIMAELVKKGFPARLVTRVSERGLSSAVIEGFHQARGDILICMDADLSHPPEVIPKLFQSIEADGTDFVIGSRYVPGAGTDESWGLFRWLNSKVATLLARPFTSAKDPMSGFFAIQKNVFSRAEKLNPIGYKIALELIVKCRCRTISEIPIHFANRKFGESKLSLREQINYIKHLKRLADFKYGWFSHLAQFCLVGSTGMVVDLGTYWILLAVAVPWFSHIILSVFPAGSLPSLRQAGIAVGLGRGVAIWMAMTWNFFINRRITFSQSRYNDAMRQYWQFVAACSLGAFINWAISVALPHWFYFFNNYKLIAAVVGIAAGTIFNFVLSRYWVFRRLN